jgi:hypothetical protein
VIGEMPGCTPPPLPRWPAPASHVDVGVGERFEGELLRCHDMKRCRRGEGWCPARSTRYAVGCQRRILTLRASRPSFFNSTPASMSRSKGYCIPIPCDRFYTCTPLPMRPRCAGRMQPATRQPAGPRHPSNMTEQFLLSRATSLRGLFAIEAEFCGL